MDKHRESKKESKQPADGRKAYEAPELKDMGAVKELTNTAFVTAGTDSGYS